MADGLFSDIGSTISNTLSESGALSNVGQGLNDAMAPAMEQIQHATELLNELHIDVAGMTEAQHAQVLEAVQDLVDHGDATEQNVNHAVLDAQEAEAAHVRADANLDEQVKAIEAGDYDRAHDLAVEVRYDRQAEADLGRPDTDARVLEADHDVLHTDQAAWHQDIAADNAASAASYLDHGDAYHAEHYADAAADHGAVSTDYAGSADHGGSYASHDTSSASTSSADTTAE